MNLADLARMRDPMAEPSDPSLSDDHAERTLQLLRFLIREVRPYRALFGFHERSKELRERFADAVRLEADINAETVRRRYPELLDQEADRG